MNLLKPITAVLLAAATHFAAAQVVTIQAQLSQTIPNGIPFGAPGKYGPHMGFVYKNIPAFDLKAGGTIAFDIYTPNDVPLSYDISLAATAVNGGVTAGGPFTLVAANALASDIYGNSIVGDYDLVFTVSQGFTFAGGGLVIDLAPTGAAASDTTNTGGWFVGAPPDTAPGQFVTRYYKGKSAGVGVYDGNLEANVQFNLSPVPEPTSLALSMVGLVALGAGARIRKLRG